MYKAIIRWTRTNFGFSRTEANGYLILLIFLVAAHFGITRFPFGASGNYLSLQHIDSLSHFIKSLQDTSCGDKQVLKTFNPNTVARDSLIGWGLDPYVASNLIKYRESGGSFQKPGDLQKLYGMTDSIWREIEPWIIFTTADDPLVKQKFKPQERDPEPALSVKNLNEVDSTWLKSIYGIGPVLSKRIVKYRELLGGFNSIEQLNEVYGLSKDVIAALGKRTFVAPGSVKKVDLNTKDYQIIAKHPYFTFNQARAIVAFTAVHGPFTAAEELKKVHLINDSTYLRVYPYLDF